LIKLLIISYHALPFDVVSSYRTKGYCDYLYENGIFPTLLTHKWEKDENSDWINQEKKSEIIYEHHNTYDVIRLPKPKENILSNSFLKTFKHWLRGEFEMHLLESNKVFRTFIFQHLRGNKYDSILAIFSPHFHLKLAYEVHKEFKVPYILDFRDLWDNQVVTKSYKPSFKKRVQDILIKLYWKKWLKRSLFFSTTSNKWTNYLEKLSDKKGSVIPNGHEIDEIEKPRKQEAFKLTYFGRLYPDQNLELLVDGINAFINKENPKYFKLLLIGLKKTSDFDGLQFITSRIDAEHLEVVDYLAKEELIEFCKREVTMFFLPSFFEDNGQFMVKLYDFIALGKPVLVAPMVNSDMESVVKKTNSGVILNSSDSIVINLEEQYHYFMINGYAKNDIDTKSILVYHRQNQVKFFAEKLKSVI
jgi:glycosyltransferase involved in cell wall biosynthesis